MRGGGLTLVDLVIESKEIFHGITVVNLYEFTCEMNSRTLAYYLSYPHSGPLKKAAQLISNQVKVENYTN